VKSWPEAIALLILTVRDFGFVLVLFWFRLGLPNLTQHKQGLTYRLNTGVFQA